MVLSAVAVEDSLLSEVFDLGIHLVLRQHTLQPLGLLEIQSPLPHNCIQL